jgi:hypothetical protein
MSLQADQATTARWVTTPVPCGHSLANELCPIGGHGPFDWAAVGGVKYAVRTRPSRAVISTGSTFDSTHSFSCWAGGSLIA